MNLGRDNHPELRDAVRQLCAKFDSAYWQEVDEKRTYPEAFVAALTGGLFWFLRKRRWF